MKPLVVELPISGKIVLPCTPKEALLQPRPANEDRHKLKSHPPRNGACIHIGQPLEASTCRKKFSEVWGCELYGKCAPRSERTPAGAVNCRLCDDFEQAAEPGWAKLAKNLVTAEAKWVLAGRPTRSPEEIGKLMSICSGCAFLKTSKNGATYCGKCGCPVSLSLEYPSRNKLAMATESCPIQKW